MFCWAYLSSIRAANARSVNPPPGRVAEAGIQQIDFGDHLDRLGRLK
jgi:hypothetical protein